MAASALFIATLTNFSYCSARKTPIVVLSVRAADRDKMRALDMGADDYVMKPFSVDELLARVRAQLRRRADEGGAGVLQFPGPHLDLKGAASRRAHGTVHLTPTELAILDFLASHAGKPITIRQIIGRVWRGAPGTTPTRSGSTSALSAGRSSPTPPARATS